MGTKLRFALRETSAHLRRYFAKAAHDGVLVDLRPVAYGKANEGNVDRSSHNSAMVFVRDDQPRSETCCQIALAIRDEVADLEAAGIGVIQIDEPALREGLPLLRSDWPEYFRWAVECFRLASSGVRDETQIHTHMCYAEFQDIIEAVGTMDADVISIETSRSQMELLDAFAQYHYPNDIGPGVYDIHSPRVPSKAEIITLLRKAAAVLSPSQIWVNPDCGLKTRRWEEVRPALITMVEAARSVRGKRPNPATRHW